MKFTVIDVLDLNLYRGQTKVDSVNWFGDYTTAHLYFKRNVQGKTFQNIPQLYRAIKKGKQLWIDIDKRQLRKYKIIPKVTKYRVGGHVKTTKGRIYINL